MGDNMDEKVTPSNRDEIVLKKKKKKKKHLTPEERERRAAIRAAKEKAAKEAAKAESSSNVTGLTQEFDLDPDMAETIPTELDLNSVPDETPAKEVKSGLTEEFDLDPDMGETIPMDLEDLPEEEPEEFVLDEDEAEEVLEEELSEEELPEEELLEEEEPVKPKKKHKVLKAFGIVLGVVAGVAAIGYGGFTYYFTNHFQFHTSVNGQDFSLQPTSVVEEYLKEGVKGYNLTLVESTGNKEVINGSDIGMEYVETDELNQLVKDQNAFLWPLSLYYSSDLTANTQTQYDQAKLKAVAEKLNCMKAENQKAPESSKPVFDKDADKYVPGDEVVGTTINKDEFMKQLMAAADAYAPELDMTETNCYTKPQYVKDSPEIQKLCDELNKYLGANVTYTFGDKKEVVNSELISQWVSYDEEFHVTFNEEKVAEYMKYLADTYQTYQVMRTFTSGSGAEVKVEGGDYGWIIDEPAEGEALLEHIKKGETIEKEPVYIQKAASHGDVDWGDTYVEVDLTNQNVYLYVKGELIISGPCVTGRPSRGDATPQGVYLIKSCSRNVTLRGPKKDGKYEWESPVKFWMPFNGGIGLHDAPWQAAFGGNRYLTHGSHGCVNLQYNVVETIYNNVAPGTPVVCHY